MCWASHYSREAVALNQRMTDKTMLFSSVGWSPLSSENHKKLGATPLGSESIGMDMANLI